VDVSDQRLDGRTAIVTGAGQGVGEGIATVLAARGATVVVAARRAETGEPVAEHLRRAGGTAVCVATDVESRDSVFDCAAVTVKEFGGLDIMVHNAFRGAHPHRLESVDYANDWEPMSRTGVWGAFYCAQAAWPHLREAGRRGRFMIVTSPAGIEGSHTIPLYSAVKAAERAIVKSLAREWGPAGVTVNGIAPVAVTPALSVAFERRPALRAAIEARTPLRRLGDPADDIGVVAAFLAGDDAGYVTGQTIVCDGGSFLGL